jgi:Fe2+ transport system protein FeoA
MNMSRTLKDMKPGDSSRVIRLAGEGEFRRRLMDMGLIKGSKVVVKKLAPLGDPIEVEVKGYSLSLRLEEAAKVFVE